MVKTAKNALVVLLGLVLGAAQTAAAGSMGTSNADFLRIQPGAAPAAMGGAYTALAQDIYATCWNPAGLASLKGRSISFMHLAWFQSLNYEFLAYAQTLGPGQGLGAHVIYFWVPDFNSTTDETGSALDPVAGKMYDLAVGLSFGYDLGYSYSMRGRTSLGGTMKIINRQLMDMSAQTVNVDLGIMVQAENGLIVGLTALNMGSEIDGEQSPLAVKLGLGWPLKLSARGHQLRLGVDLIKPIDVDDWGNQKWKMYLGAEYLLLESLAFRIGYQSGEDLAGVTAGLGVQFGSMQLDYAFVPYGLLGYTHRISLSVNFPGAYRSQPAVVNNANTPSFGNRPEEIFTGK